MNRVAAEIENELVYEAVQRHAEVLMRDVGIDEGRKGLTTPGVSTTEGGQAREALVGGESLLRAVAVRGNYLGEDRMNTQFAAKEINAFTSKPEEQDWRSAKRLARHLKDKNRIAIEHNFQRLPEKAAALSDVDFVGRKRTRRSTSGGGVMFGNHCIETYS